MQSGSTPAEETLLHLASGNSVMRVPEEDKRDQAVSPAAGMTLLCKFPHCYPLKPAMLSDEIRRRLGRRYYFVCTAWSC